MVDRAHASEATLAAYLEGRLSPTEQGAVEAHIDACEPCSMALQRAALFEEQLYRVAAVRRWARVPLAGAGRHVLSVGVMAASVLMMVAVDLPREAYGVGSTHQVVAVADPPAQHRPRSECSERGADLAACDALVLATFPDDDEAEAAEGNVCIVRDDEALVCTLEDAP